MCSESGTIIMISLMIQAPRAIMSTSNSSESSIFHAWAKHLRVLVPRRRATWKLTQPSAKVSCDTDFPVRSGSMIACAVRGFRRCTVAFRTRHVIGKVIPTRTQQLGVASDRHFRRAQAAPQVLHLQHRCKAEKDGVSLNTDVSWRMCHPQ